MTNLTGKNFKRETQRAKLPVLVGFYGSGSLQEEPLSELERKHGNRLKFCRVDTDREQDLARQFGILSVPTLVLMEEGKVQQRIRGEQSKEALTQILDLD